MFTNIKGKIHYKDIKLSKRTLKMSKVELSPEENCGDSQNTLHRGE